MYRGDGADRPSHVALPPGPMPLWHNRRPLKRWRYVGVYGKNMMLCAGEVHVAGIPQVFWAVWDREKQVLRDHTIVMRTAAVDLAPGSVHVRDRGVEIDLTLEHTGDVVEVVSMHGRGHIWTRKQLVSATGAVSVDGDRRLIGARGLLDESAGYHARHTAWSWAAGIGATTDGRAVAWNLVDGVHDGPTESERTVWVDGTAHEVGPATFGPDLDSVTYREGGLRFTTETARRRRDRLVVISSDYVQPFGLATGELLPGVELAEGYGVMERHRATW